MSSELLKLYAGSATNDDTLLPDGAASGEWCHEYSNGEFEQVVLDSNPNGN